MDQGPHKLMDALPAYWPVISGLFVTIIAAIKLWRENRKQLLNRVANVECIAQNAATKDELAAMGKKICAEIKEVNVMNSQQHQDILKVVASQKT